MRSVILHILHASTCSTMRLHSTSSHLPRMSVYRHALGKQDQLIHCDVSFTQVFDQCNDSPPKSSREERACIRRRFDNRVRNFVIRLAVRQSSFVIARSGFMTCLVYREAHTHNWMITTPARYVPCHSE
jgi:hypothetical protein